MAHRARVLVTGVGAVSPIGIGVREYVAGLRAGRSGVRALPESMRSGRIRSRVGALCVGFDGAAVVGEGDARRLPRLVPMALMAAREAMSMAGLAWSPADAGGGDGPLGEFAGRVGLILGTGAGGIDFTLDQAAAGHEGRRPSLWTITNATHGNLAGELSIRLGLRGPSLCVSTGCASSSDAAGLAMEALRSSNPAAPEAVVVVGADAHVRWETLLGMELLGVITTRDWREASDDRRERPETASRPFDRTRDGFVLGEGAWALVLEREATARRREAPPEPPERPEPPEPPEPQKPREPPGLAEMLGYAATCDAHHRVRPEPNMRESARAMRLAMEDAGVGAREVGVVHYHGTSTALNDAAETSAVKAAFAEAARRVRGTSVKSMIGHPQGACGAAALVAAIGCGRALDGDARGPFVPPTINLEEPDPACDLEYTANEAAVVEGGGVALVNCLAFGAKNSALVVRVSGSGGAVRP